MTGSAKPLPSLRNRRDFLRLRRGLAVQSPCFIMAAKSRTDETSGLRFGITVTKKLCKKATERNRIKRRLREAIRLSAPARAADHTIDFVLIARSKALTEEFTFLQKELDRGLAKAFREILRDRPRQSSPSAQT